MLRQPLTAYCCFYTINSIVLWFVIFLGMKIILAQIYRDYNAISKQTLHLLARTFVNTTKCAELCTHSLPEQMLKLQRLPGALNSFLNQAFCRLGSNHPAQQCRVPRGNKKAHLPASSSGEPSCSTPSPASRPLQGHPRAAQSKGISWIAPVQLLMEGKKGGGKKLDKSFDQRIFFHIQPTVLMIPKLFCICAKSVCAKTLVPKL